MVDWWWIAGGVGGVGAIGTGVMRHRHKQHKDIAYLKQKGVEYTKDLKKNTNRIQQLLQDVSTQQFAEHREMDQEGNLLAKKGQLIDELLRIARQLQGFNRLNAHSASALRLLHEAGEIPRLLGGLTFQSSDTLRQYDKDLKREIKEFAKVIRKEKKSMRELKKLKKFDLLAAKEERKEKGEKGMRAFFNRHNFFQKKERKAEKGALKEERDELHKERDVYNNQLEKIRTMIKHYRSILAATARCVRGQMKIVDAAIKTELRSFDVKGYASYAENIQRNYVNERIGIEEIDKALSEIDRQDQTLITEESKEQAQIFNIRTGERKELGLKKKEQALTTKAA